MSEYCLGDVMEAINAHARTVEQTLDVDAHLGRIADQLEIHTEQLETHNKLMVELIIRISEIAMAQLEQADFAHTRDREREDIRCATRREIKALVDGDEGGKLS